MNDQLKVIGQPIIRKDALDKVTGAARYTADIPYSLEGIASENVFLIGKVVRSTHHHAKIVRIDTTKANQVDGVAAVITGADVQGELDNAVEKIDQDIEDNQGYPLP